MLSARDMEDRELARAARAGSLDSFEAIVGRYERRIYSFVANQCRNQSDSEEVTQETFVRAWQGLYSWDDSRPFCSWLFTIARNKCIDRRRAAVRFVETEPEEGVDENTPSEIAACREEGAALWADARRLLPPTQYECLWLRYAEDMETKEIATVMGIGKTHVKVLLFRARMALAKRLPARVEGYTVPALNAKVTRKDSPVRSEEVVSL